MNHDNERLLTVLEVVLLIAVIMFLLGIIYMASELETRSPVSRCQEDVVLVGQGQFQDGKWDYYVCGPNLDDYVTLHLYWRAQAPE